MACSWRSPASTTVVVVASEPEIAEAGMAVTTLVATTAAPITPEAIRAHPRARPFCTWVMLSTLGTGRRLSRGTQVVNPADRSHEGTQVVNSAVAVTPRAVGL